MTARECACVCGGNCVVGSVCPPRATRACVAPRPARAPHSRTSSWPWHALALGWAGLAVQQAHNQRSGTAGRAQGVCMDGGMRACEGGVATEQRSSTPLLGRSRSSILRPTLWHGSDPPWVDVCRRREGSWAAMFCVDSWICVVSFGVKIPATAPSNSGRRPDHDGMLGLFLTPAVPEIWHSTGRNRHFYTLSSNAFILIRIRSHVYALKDKTALPATAGRRYERGE